MRKFTILALLGAVVIFAGCNQYATVAYVDQKDLEARARDQLLNKDKVSNTRLEENNQSWNTRFSGLEAKISSGSMASPFANKKSPDPGMKPTPDDTHNQANNNNSQDLVMIIERQGKGRVKLTIPNGSSELPKNSGRQDSGSINPPKNEDKFDKLSREALEKELIQENLGLRWYVHLMPTPPSAHGHARRHQLKYVEVKTGADFPDNFQCWAYEYHEYKDSSYIKAGHWKKFQAIFALRVPKDPELRLRAGQRRIPTSRYTRQKPSLVRTTSRLQAQLSAVQRTVTYQVQKNRASSYKRKAPSEKVMRIMHDLELTKLADQLEVDHTARLSKPADVARAYRCGPYMVAMTDQEGLVWWPASGRQT